MSDVFGRVDQHVATAYVIASNNWDLWNLRIDFVTIMSCDFEDNARFAAFVL